MVRIPSLSRRSDPPRDENRDGRIDGRDEPTADGSAPVGDAGPVATDRDADRGTYRSRSAADGAGAAPGTDEARTGTADATSQRRAAERGATARAATARGTGDTAEQDRVATARPDGGTPGATVPADTDRTADQRSGVDHTPDRPVVPAPAGPRPRASMLATLSLIVGVAAALFVLTGTLAGYGIGLGGLALLLAIGGISATGRRHIAGRSEALIGLALGLGAVIVGVLAMTGEFTWPTTDGDTVLRFREWLDAQFVDRF